MDMTACGHISHLTAALCVCVRRLSDYSDCVAGAGHLLYNTPPYIWQREMDVVSLGLNRAFPRQDYAPGIGNRLYNSPRPCVGEGLGERGLRKNRIKKE